MLLTMSDNYLSLPEGIQKQYSDKLRRLGLNVTECDPFSANKKWIDDVSKWPNVEFGQIYCCLNDNTDEFTSHGVRFASLLTLTHYVYISWSYS